MALSNLSGWNDEKTASACGATCGASDEIFVAPVCCAAHPPEEKPAACGSACGAGDKE
ncbi:MAG: ACGX-repeat peptide [Faecalibacterium sp.]|nr:ACGX-repeat peptide [Ruminococcus sp.]MCM1392751.1 ACGX-repeat peptide [Ruminococcus sp.]MCM1486293.1 ACGX-repeat peptide [Faecalibacterium sp.]